MSDTERKDLDMEPLRLIDVCCEDDCLLASSSGFSEYQIEDDCFNLFEVKDAKESEDTEHLKGQMYEEPISSKRVEAEIPRKNGKCNLRKSLAWDKAFFTNEGVLDPEELSFINNGVKKTALCPLPGIQEDVRRSADSNSTYNSTLDSDSMTMESLEVDLFEDIRASIQRSSKAPNVDSTSSKKALGVPEQKKAVLGVSAPKKTGLAGRSGIKPVVAPKRQSVNTKETIVRPGVIQPVARSGESNPSALKPPKILGRANLVSAAPLKKTSVAASRVKVDNNTAKAALVAARGEHVAVSKKPSLLRSSVTLRPTPLSKSSLSATQMKSTASCSSYSTSGSTSSDSSAKSPLKSGRNKIDSRNVIPVSRSTLKSPLRISSRNRIESENSRLSAYLKSIPKPKLSSNISPASSIDGWSSESSSSTSTLNQWSNGSKANVGINSSRRGSINVGIDSPRGGSINVGIGSPRRGSSLRRDSHTSQASEVDNPSHDDLPSVNQCAKKTSQGSSALSHPASTNVSKSFKPSGLRMPSPKIGFFDAEKSLVHTPNGSSQSRSGARSGLSKVGSGTVPPKEDAVKTKASKLQPARTLKGASNIKLDSEETGLSHSSSSKNPASPEQLQEIFTDSPKFVSPSEVQNDSSSGTSREKPSKTKSVGKMLNAEMVDQDSVSNSGFGLKNNMGTGSAIKISSCKKDGPQISKETSDCQRDSINLPKTSDEKPVTDQRHLENNLHSLHISNEKENYSCSDDQVDGLSRQVETVDLNVDVVKEAIHDLADPKLDSTNSSTLHVHCQEDLQKISLKPNPLFLSPNTMEILSNTRAPLANNVSFCYKSESFGSAPESTMDIVPSMVALPECIQKEKS